MIAIVNIQKILDALINWVKSDYNSFTDKTKTWLYNEFNGIELGNWNFYNELVALISKGKNDPKRLTTHLSFPRNKPTLPYIFIHVPSETKGEGNSLGFGNNTPYTLNSSGKEMTNAERHYDAVFDLVIVSENEMVSISIYELLIKLFQASPETLYSQFGFELFEFMGKEFMVNNAIAPDQVFHKAVQIKINYNREVRRINVGDVINAIAFNQTNQEQEGFEVTIPVVLRNELPIGSSRSFLIPFLDYLDQPFVLDNYYKIKIDFFYDNNLEKFLTYATENEEGESELIIYDNSQGLLRVNMTDSETTDRELRDVYYQITSYLTEDDYNDNITSVKTVKQYILTFVE